ncbi:GNAT family N-acetyltransferase [Roseomonas sp. CAU 1739]|uniref:GNAT family N-acetyltransferase n=1 Tax=Roseomonas sp. CAU 1739 TaxID=3140364 RepID=UPI00325BE3BF
MDTDDWPDGTTMTLAEEPEAGFRAELAHHIHAFHGTTVPHEARRFGLALRDADGRLRAGVAGLMSWGWLFIEAAWVDDALRGQGVGRGLMHRAETHARACGCHAAWLDTFQAEGFYRALGYERFGLLEAYPAGQARSFLRKSLR